MGFCLRRCPDPPNSSVFSSLESGLLHEWQLSDIVCEMSREAGIHAGVVCIDFCPLGSVCERSAAEPLGLLRDAVERQETLDGEVDIKELSGLVDRVINCEPKKIGEVMLDGMVREVFECPAAELSNTKPQFIV